MLDILFGIIATLSILAAMAIPPAVFVYIVVKYLLKRI